MDLRGVLLSGSVVISGALATVTACTGPDPGTITFAERVSGMAPDALGGSSGVAVDGGPGTATDGGGTTTTANAVFADTIFAYDNPGVTANNANGAHGGTVEGKDCMVAGCHLGGNKPWVFAGTVYTTAQGGTTVPLAEVRVVDATNKEIGRAYTDPNGNFWLQTVAGKVIPANAKVGVRREGGPAPKLMATPLVGPTNAGCSSVATNCHGTAGTGKVFIP